ncbi:MAG: hypothetical protein LQ340_003015 [Diploschistes diacapsis]|nr:MAG: hypothetical protein LQ340_003015 [Diploschistes diacapsis]
MALWQVFPIWTSLSQQIFKLLVPRSSLSGKSDKEKAKHGMSALRAVYIIALIGAASTQIATLTLCFTSAMFPMLFNPASVAAWAPSKVLVPAAITPSLKVSSVAEGALLFLQYDEIIGSSALLLVVGNAVGNKWTPKGALQWLASVMGTATGYILLGPGGLAVVGMWVRDEILFAEEGEKGKRKN